MDSSQRGLAVSVITLVCLAAQVGYALASLARQCAEGRLHPAWLSWLRRQYPWRREQQDPVISKLIHEKIMQMRVRYMRSLAFWVSLGCCFVCLMRILRMVSGFTRLTMTPGQEVSFAAVFILVTIFRVFPRLLNSRSVFIVYGGFMLFIMVVSGLVADREWIVKNMTSIQVCCLALALAHFDIRGSLFWNLLLDISMLASFAKAKNNGACHQIGLGEFFSQRCFTFILKMIAAYTVERLFESCIRREFEAKKERNSRLAVTSLLKTICDAVVELDSDRRIVQHEDRLAHMLIHGAGGKSLQGSTLEDFLPEADREHFEQRLSDGGREGHAAMFHMRLKDSMGNRIPVQCYHVSYTTLDNSCNHLIGFSEDSDRQWCESSAATRDTGVEVQVAREVSPHTDVPENLLNRQASAGSSSSASSWPSLAAQASPGGSMDSSPVVKVCVRDSRLVVVWSSEAFQEKFGEIATGSDFAQVVTEGAELFDCISRRVDGLLEGTLAPGIVEFPAVTVPLRGQVRGVGQQRPRVAMLIFPPPHTGCAVAGGPPTKFCYEVAVLIGHRLSRTEAPPAVPRSSGTAAAGSDRGDLSGRPLAGAWPVSL